LEHGIYLSLNRILNLEIKEDYIL